MRPIKADAALTSFNAGGQGITWAVLDTGVQANHPHFANGVIKEVWDCTKRGAAVQIDLTKSKDKDGHGTHVSGIIAGHRADKPDAERGVAPAARLVVYKVLNDNGEGEDAWIIKALDHIAAKNEQITGGLAVHGINLSLGGPFDNTVYGCGFSPICAELRRLWRNGVVVVVSSGNEGTMQVTTPDGEAEIIRPCRSAIRPTSRNASRSVRCMPTGRTCTASPRSRRAARPPTAAPSPTWSRPASASARATRRSARATRSPSIAWTAAPAWPRPTCPGCWRRSCPCGASSARPAPTRSSRCCWRPAPTSARDRYHQGRGMPNLMQMLLAV